MASQNPLFTKYRMGTDDIGEVYLHFLHSVSCKERLCCRCNRQGETKLEKAVADTAYPKGDK